MQAGIVKSVEYLRCVGDELVVFISDFLMVIIIYVSELFSLLRDRYMKYSTARQSCSYAQQYLNIRVHIFIETKKLPKV